MGFAVTPCLSTTSYKLSPTQISLPYSCLNCFETHRDGPGLFVGLWEPGGLNRKYTTKGSDFHSPRIK